ncbi:uncharacterized protein L969DRAFT_52231 [Mixia osmundae IAM 14324]|uniref:Uncharacterized protein n=1 Tax=Mixia osmundae (strain CBS 9802 / IAM 14324 / JCM 22182 / KY 12970) TaxID=764103 RepID=G7E4W7_MIXOS|nr:uncharacterized protein L969DRAFT_52231 [Mixia osmundae IAM 14324]KEI37739.1 hypothetical protein L969DRAFT_52231 [Mixia osmundae IAM 14324]GAA97877.1 hypothetical protein E5Q_04557 [Mixia osmundae IAM 14324]
MTAMSGDYVKLLRGIAEQSSSLAQRVKEIATLSTSDEDELAYPDGISLLTAKNDLLLGYIQQLVFLHLHTSLAGQPLSNLSSSDKEGATDLVGNLIRTRLILEKIRPIESKLKYQMDKLIRKAHTAADTNGKSNDPADQEHDELAQDPLAFRPNPAAMLARHTGSDDGSAADEDEDGYTNTHARPGIPRTGIYRPPRLAPVPYSEKPGGKGKGRAPATNLLTDLATSLSSSNPYAETTSGLSITPTVHNRQAKRLADMKRYEEDNMTRLFMKKKDSKRRRQDEEEVALGGGSGSSGSRRRGHGGFEGELGDVLAAISTNGKRNKRAYDEMSASRAPRSKSHSSKRRS